MYRITDRSFLRCTTFGTRLSKTYSPFTLEIDLSGIARLVRSVLIIGASLSEPHTCETASPAIYVIVRSPEEGSN